MIALPRAAPPTDSIACDGGLGELVDVGAGARARPTSRRSRRRSRRSGTGATRETAATIGMVAWPPQVTMLTFGGVEVLVEVDRRDDERADRGRGEVDQPLAVRRERRGVRLVGAGRGGVEDDVDLVEARQRDQARRRRRRWSATPSRAARASPSESGSMPTIAAISSVVGQPHDLDHQVGADVARADDGDLHRVIASRRRSKVGGDRRRAGRSSAANAVARRRPGPSGRARRRARRRRRAAAEP